MVNIPILSNLLGNRGTAMNAAANAVIAAPNLATGPGLGFDPALINTVMLQAALTRHGIRTPVRTRLR